MTPVPLPTLRDARGDAVRRPLAIAGPAAALLFAGLAPIQALGVEGDGRGIVVGLGLLTAALFLLVALHARHRHPREQPVAGLAGLLAVATLLAQLAVDGTAPHAGLLVLALVGCGAVLVSRAWLVAVFAVAGGCWTVLAWRAGTPAAWVEHGALLGLGALVGVVVHVGRVAAVRRAYREALDEARSRRELAASANAAAAGEQRYRALVELAPVGVLTVDRGHISFVNRVGAHLMGLVDADDLIGLPAMQIVPPDERAQALLRWDHIVAKGVLASTELGLLRPDGSRFAAEVAACLIDGGEERSALVVFRDVTARIEAERLRDEIVSVVGHELRTPVTSILGALGLVVGGAAGELPERVAYLLSVAHRNAERMSQLINDLLDLERLESGRVAVDARLIDLVDVVTGVVRVHQPLAAHHGTRFALQTGAGQARVLGDPDRLTQVFANLLSNAAKYAPEGSDVGVRVLLVDGEVRVEVQDRGPGIPEAFWPHVFERFRQAESFDARQHGGSGLGLAIAEELVLRHGGRIGFDTSPAGTTFFVVLPLVTSDTPLV